MAYSLTELQLFGFQGFDLLSNWDTEQIFARYGRDIEGVYVVARESMATPRFKDEFHHRPRPKVWTDGEAAQRWVEGVQTLYFGKGPLRSPKPNGKRDGLANRIEELRAHGLERGSNHYGGKLLWQLADSEDLLLGWKPVKEGTSGQVESGLILGFKRLIGQQPYANVGHPLKNSRPIFLT